MAVNQTPATPAEPVFDDLYDVLSANELVLPIGGKQYRIAEVDGETGLWCQRIGNLATKHRRGVDVSDQLATLDDDEEQDLYERLLGPVLQELVDDGVSWPKIQHVARTALVWVVSGKEAAAVAWRLGEAPAANREERRRKGGTATPAAARSTRKPASASGTTRTRQTSARATPAKATRGRTS